MGAAIAPIGLAAGIAGGVISAVGSYNSMEAQSRNAAYQAQVAANNATIARRNAGMEIQAGEIAAVNQGMKTRATVGKTLAAQGASGVDVNSGSALKVRTAEAEIGVLDALTIRSGAAKKAYSYDTQAGSYQAEGGLLRNQSEQADSAAPVAAGGSLLSSASTVGGGYMRYLQTV